MESNTLTKSFLISRKHTLTIGFTHNISNISFAITNVYASTDPQTKAIFVEDLSELSTNISGPWLLFGDFNLTRYPYDKNNSNFDLHLANLFNEKNDDLALLEIPLFDWLFTWSSKREIPTLSRIDRAFINQAWNLSHPNTSLSSLPRTTSDHVPLKISISTSIPKTQVFRFDNHLLCSPNFLPTILWAWVGQLPTHHPTDAAGNLVANLKKSRFATKNWIKAHKLTNDNISDCSLLIDFLDSIEEARPLSTAEFTLRDLVQDKLADLHRCKAIYWKQRSKIKRIKASDENTKFFHAHASHRFRNNGIHSLLLQGSQVFDHDTKADALYEFFYETLGGSANTTWDFHLQDLYPENTVHNAS